ncbi:MAG: CvpA family protein [Bacteroidetes bacterium]|nr:CvpA family protein [Bacteroidales bacterium]MBU1009871.1 CvpA family protein [Bacteroidota bacterium]
MNYLDIIIAVLLLFSAYNGYSKGLVIELASLAALILGVYVAILFSDVTGDFLSRYFELHTKYLSIIAFMLTFVLVLIAVMLVGKLVEKFVDLLLLGFLNKLAGAVFGILKGALILSIIIFLLNYFDAEKKLISKDSRKSSFLYNRIEQIAPTIYKKLHLPEKIEITVPFGDEDKKIF